jgi:heme/copper-type cytochrome/quinol oxidase subunit 2
MENIIIIIIAVLIFLLYTFLFWKFTSGDVKREYGVKMWKNWTVKLYYWQAAVFYSLGFTAITLFLFKWGNVLNF